MKKKVLITGGSSGIGKSMVRLFARKNYSVHFTYNTNQQSAAQLMDELNQNEVEMYHFDQGEEQSVKQLLSVIPPDISILINNAALGSGTVQQISDDPYEQDRKLLEVNVLGVLWLTQGILPRMRETGGKIINISSVGGGIFHFKGFRIADGISKAAITYLTKHLAAELSHSKIDVFAICPGATDTNMFQVSTLNKMNDPQRKAFVKNLA